MFGRRKTTKKTGSGIPKFVPGKSYQETFNAVDSALGSN